MCSSSSNLCTFVQLQFTAVRCYATDPAAGGANGPPQSRLDFGNRKGRGSEREKEWKGKGEWERSKRGERWGEKENGTKGRKKEKRKKGRGREEFCAVVVFVLGRPKLLA